MKDKIDNCKVKNGKEILEYWTSIYGFADSYEQRWKRSEINSDDKDLVLDFRHIEKGLV